MENQHTLEQFVSPCKIVIKFAIHIGPIAMHFSIAFYFSFSQAFFLSTGVKNHPNPLPFMFTRKFFSNIFENAYRET